MSFTESIMMIQNNNITEKKYQKLSIQIALDGLSFCCFDTLNNKVVSLKEIDFSDFSNPTQIEYCLEKVFYENPFLQKTFDEIVILHDNNLTTLVPKALFEEKCLRNYLQYNTKIFETDFFTFDELPNYEINNVYIPYVNVNNFLIDKIGSFDYKHVNSVLVSKILDFSKNRDEKQIFSHFRKNHFELIVVQNQKLLLFNSFEYKTAEDFLYYLLFTAEQLKLNPEYFKLLLLGDCNEESTVYKLTYKYVRNISLFDLSLISSYNNLSEKNMLKHFILLHS